MIDDYEHIRDEFLRSFMIPAVEFDQNPSNASEQSAMLGYELMLKMAKEVEMKKRIREQLKSGRGVIVYGSDFAPKDRVLIVPHTQISLNGDYTIICHQDHKPKVQAMLDKLAKELQS